MKHWKAIGVMSGSSLDGLDIAYVELAEEKGRWSFEIEKAETVVYDEFWQNTLQKIRTFQAEELVKLHLDYGRYTGRLIRQFIERNHLAPDIVATHGHTVFHNPAQGYTFQLGQGQAVANLVKVPVVADFRTADILLGGQGAPLVPIGDELLFGNYSACLNLGGIANISFRKSGKRLAFDISPANQLLNHLASQKGLAFDYNGETARSGILEKELLKLLESDTYYQKSLPKSLSNEYVWERFVTLLDDYNTTVENKLHTVTVHIANEIAKSLKQINAENVLVTGGGGKNGYLLKLLIRQVDAEIIVPDDKVVDFKEALIFALMGVLKMEGRVNCLSSATGASRDCSAGTIFYPL